MSCGGALTEHAAHLEMYRQPCTFCGADVVRGRTHKGAPSVFDPDTGRNHWVTCPKAAEARAAYPRKPRRPGAHE